MKAVVMAGGEGTRLRPLTSNQPKPMVPIVGKPCIEHIIELLREHGIAALVTKNSGGSATSAKLVAAGEAGLPVIMLARPAPPPGPVVPDARGAVNWLRGR